MKTKYLIMPLMVCTLFIFSGCSKPKCFDCYLFTFKETYLRYYQDEETFYIKGVTSNVKNHGRNINVFEDLKGNLAGKTSIFVWGASSISFCDHKGRQDKRVDDITQYHKSDTLIMLIKKSRKRFLGDIERSSDYSTIGGCHQSVLEFSDNSVSGPIDKGITSMSWDEFQEFLNSNK